MTANVNYPSSLPAGLISGFSNQDEQAFRSDDTRVGPPRYELLTNHAPSKFTVVFNFDAFDFQVFEAWWKSIIAFGSLPFNMKLSVGMGFVDHECYALSPYSVTRVLKRINVTMQVLAVQKQYNSDDEIQSLANFASMTAEKDQVAFYNLFNQFAETDLPDAWENINYGTDYS